MSLRRLTRAGIATAIAAAVAVAWAAPAAHGGDAAASRAISHAAPRADRLETYRRWIVLRFGSPPSAGPLAPHDDRLDALWRSLALRYGADGRPRLPAHRAEIRV